MKEHDYHALTRQRPASLYVTPKGKAWNGWRVFDDWRFDPELVCSLGGDCIAASQIKTRGLRPFSLPFDWCSSDGEESMRILAGQIDADFVDFARIENFESIAGVRFGYKDRYTGFSFIHHFKAEIDAPGEFERFDTVLQRRLERWRCAIKESRSVLFLLSRTWMLNDQCLCPVAESCHRRWPDKDFRFVMVTYNSKVSEYYHDDVFGVVRTTRDRTGYDMSCKAFEWSFLDGIKYSEAARLMHSKFTNAK